MSKYQIGYDQIQDLLVGKTWEVLSASQDRITVRDKDGNEVDVLPYAVKDSDSMLEFFYFKR